MALLKTYSKFPGKSIIRHNFSTHLPYEIPERYRNAFFLANAAQFDCINWFVHRAFEVAFSSLKLQFEDLYPNQCNSDQSGDKLRQIIANLEQCNSMVDVRLPIKRDNGKYELIRGFRAHHGLGCRCSPSLGGLRIYENVTRDQMKAFSALATYKQACLGINLSGAQGGLKMNPQKYTTSELRQTIELYAMEMFKKGCLGGSTDVFQPDINTSTREMDWISQVFANLTGNTVNTSSMGKSILFGGFGNYDKTTSLGAWYALNFFLKSYSVTSTLRINKGIKGKSFVLQGLGKLGSQLGLHLVENGATCIGVREQDGSLCDFNGIDVKALINHKAKHGSIVNYKKCRPGENDDIYKEDCDILVLAGYHKTLPSHVANKVRANIILEAADGAISPISHRILTSKDKLVIPDIFASSGATIASYFEYMQMLQYLNERNLSCQEPLRNVYKSLLNSFSNEGQEVSVESSDGSSRLILTKPVQQFLPINFLEEVLSDTGERILNVVDEYSLKLDIRTASYILAIEEIFKGIFLSKFFL